MISVRHGAPLLAQLRKVSFGSGMSRQMSSEVINSRPGPLRRYEAWASNFSWRGLVGRAGEGGGAGIEPSCKWFDSGAGTMVPAWGEGWNGAAAGLRRLGLGERDGGWGPTGGSRYGRHHSGGRSRCSSNETGLNSRKAAAQSRDDARQIDDLRCKHMHCIENRVRARTWACPKDAGLLANHGLSIRRQLALFLGMHTSGINLHVLLFRARPSNELN
jgi:hypothetical protein